MQARVQNRTAATTAPHVQSYLGLTPGEHSSSEREWRTGITKAGPMELRAR